VEVRKVASGLTALANEKQKEQRDKASGKKKTKAASKPVLGSTKVASRCVLLPPKVYVPNSVIFATQRLDTSVYDEALDDFGSNADDFM
jgi:translation initiation factor 3 subunit J